MRFINKHDLSLVILICHEESFDPSLFSHSICQRCFWQSFPDEVYFVVMASSDKSPHT